MDHLLERQAQGKATDADYDEVIFQIGVYKKSCWAFIKTFYGYLSKSRQGRALLKEAERQEDSPSKEAPPSTTVGNVVDFKAFKKKR